MAAAWGTTAGVVVPALTMLVLGALFMAMTIVIFILYGLFAAQLRGVVLARPRIADGVRWTLASLFLGLGIRLALAARG